MVITRGITRVSRLNLGDHKILVRLTIKNYVPRHVSYHGKDTASLQINQNCDKAMTRQAYQIQDKQYTGKQHNTPTSL